MGIVCSLYRAPDSTLEVLLRQPEFFRDFTRLEEEPFRFEVKPGPIGRLLGKKPRTVQLGRDVVPFVRITENERHSVDKAWHVLHYLLTGTAGASDQPLGFFLSGGQRVGEQEQGLDEVPRLFLAAETGKISRELASLPHSTLIDRFDWPEMMRCQVYPEINLQEKVPPDLWAGYQDQYRELKSFLQTASEQNEGFAITYS